MRVVLSEHTKHRIASEAAALAARNYGQIDPYMWSVSPDTAQAAYDMVFPREDQEKFRALLPEWSTRKAFDISIGVANNPVDDYALRRTTARTSGIVTDGVLLNGCGFVGERPGVKRIYYNNGCMVFDLDDDLSGIEHAELRQFFASEVKRNKQIFERDAAGKKASEAMLALLSKYNSFQKAVKVEGDYLMEYLPHDLLELYRREPPKRSKPKPIVNETANIDTDFLIAQAGIKTLGLNDL